MAEAIYLVKITPREERLKTLLPDTIHPNNQRPNNGKQQKMLKAKVKIKQQLFGNKDYHSW